MQLLCVRLDWDRTAIPLRIRGYYTLHLGPEPGYPAGRKGLVLASAWHQLGAGAAGMLILDGDVAIDPADHAAMLEAIAAEPAAVHAAPVKLWPASTKLPGWIWGHRSAGDDGLGHADPDDPDWWTFCFTYLPRRLIRAAAAAGLRRWCYPHTDQRMHELAGRLRIPARVVRGASPKHLNY